MNHLFAAITTTVIILLTITTKTIQASDPTNGVINPEISVLGGWTGDTATGSTFFLPNPALVQCGITATNARYIAINFTVVTTGVRQVALMSEVGFKPFVSVYLYRGVFSPSLSIQDSSSCSNLAVQLANQNLGSDAGILTINNPFYFEAGQQYMFVVTSSASATAVVGATGQFVLNVIESSVSGNNTAGLLWNAPSPVNPCVPSGTMQQFSTFTFLGSANVGFYDVNAMITAINVTSAGTGNQVYFAIYAGFKTPAQLAADSCQGADRVFSGTEGDQILTALYQPSLTPNSPYTAVISSRFPSMWGVQISPTRVQIAQTSAGAIFQQPLRNLTAPCAANTSASAAAYISLDLVPQQGQVTFFVDTYAPQFTQVTEFPNGQFSFGYNGQNSALVACPANASLISLANTGSGFNSTGGNSRVSTPLIVPAPHVGTHYTAVISTNDGSSLSQQPPTTAWGTEVFVLTGQLVGVVSTTNSTNSTLSSSTTASLTSSTGSSSNNTSSSTTAAASTTAASTSTTAAPPSTTAAPTSTAESTSPSSSSTGSPVRPTTTTSSSSSVFSSLSLSFLIAAAAVLVAAM